MGWVVQWLLKLGVRNTLFILCLLQVVVLKNLFYKLLGWFLGLQPLSSMDEFWLYDYAINPINVPSFLIFKRGKMAPEEFAQRIYQRLGRTFSNRCAVKHVKIFGKYYFKLLSDSEYRQWQATNTGIVPEVKTYKQLIDFGLRNKRVEGKDFSTCSVYGYLFPNLENDEWALMF